MSFLRKNIAYLQGKLADIASSRRQFISEKADILVCLRKIQASPRGESQTVRLSLAKENSAQLLTIFVLSFVALTL